MDSIGLKENYKKPKKTYIKSDLIKMIAKDKMIRLSVVKKVFDGIEEQITEILSSANENNDVSVRLFDGISIDGVYLPEKEKVNNLTGEIINAKSKIKPKANITRNYCEKLTRLAKDK